MADYLERRWVELVMVSVTYSCQAATRCHACRYVTDECVTELLRPICQVEAVRDCPAQLSLRLGPPLAPLPLQLCSLLALLLLALTWLSYCPSPLPHVLTPRDYFCLCTLVSAVLSICYIRLTTLLSFPSAQWPGGPWRVTAHEDKATPRAHTRTSPYGLQVTQKGGL